MNRIVLGLCTTAMAVALCVAQESSEDVLFTNSGSILRGTITDKITPGGTITVIQPGGKSSVAFWSELVAVRRFPRGIPDSVIRGSFDYHEARDQQGHRTRLYEAPRKTPKFEFKGYDNDEDVVFLVDGSILRGVLINQRSDGVYSLWTSGMWKEIGGPAVLSSVKVKRGIPDSTLVNTYVSVPEEWRAGELRILSLHGGLSIPVGGLLTPQQDGRSSAKLGPAVGAQVGFRLWPGFRWLVDATVARHPREVPVFFLDAPTSGSGATALNVVQIMTGIEMRTFSSSDFRARFAALLGMIYMEAGGYEATFGQTFYHFAGTAKVDAISASSFGFSLGAGLLAGRFSLDIAWIYFRPKYTATTNVLYQYGYTDLIRNSETENDGFLKITLGVSIY